MLKALSFWDAVEKARLTGDFDGIAQSLLAQLTPHERLNLLHGDESFWKGLLALYSNSYAVKTYNHGEVKRLGIPGIQYCDGPRGVVLHTATAFSCSTARGATWDPELERKVGWVIGREARVYGANTVGSICINLPRHPAWGRVQETYGEDPLLLGEMGAAGIVGLQENVMACVKHYALNSIENSRFRVNVSIDESALHEVFLPHFQRCADSDAYCFMTAYNAVNSEWSGESIALIRDVLRKRWKYDGITITDWVFGLRDGVKSIKADLDIEAPFRNRRHGAVKTALLEGELEWKEIDRIAGRILRTQLRFYSARATPEPSKSVVLGEEHRAIAREVATRAIVLLKNEKTRFSNGPLLPFTSDIRSCAVIGRHADSALTGDRASSWVDCPGIITHYQGIKAALRDKTVHLSASDSIENAVSAAKDSDVAVLIVGYDGGDEGEFLRPSRELDSGALDLMPEPDGSTESNLVVKIRNRLAQSMKDGPKIVTDNRPEDDFTTRPKGGDRQSIRLRPEDVHLIRAVTAVNSRTVVSIVTAGAVIIDEWASLAPSIMVSWYNGCEGGKALADILTGAANPSGRLPWSMPRDEAHLPIFEPNANEVTYDKWFGQRMLDKLGVTASYPLGYGISYTQFEFARATLSKWRKDGVQNINISVSIKNTGSRSGWCVPQVYGRPDFGPGLHDFPDRVLVGFKAISLEAGQSEVVQVKVSLEPLYRWIKGDLVLDANAVTFEVGQYAGDSGSLICRTDFVESSL